MAQAELPLDDADDGPGLSIDHELAEEESSSQPAEATPAEAVEKETPPPVEEKPAGVSESIRLAAEMAGYDISSFADDRQALSHLAQKAKEAVDAHLRADQANQIAQQLAAARREPEPPPKSEKLPYEWNPPEYNKGWLSQVRVNDETGQLEPVNGGSAETVAKIQRYAQFRRDAEDRFWENPYGFIEPFLNHQVEQLLGPAIESRLDQYAEQQQARSFIDKNSDWLFEQGTQQFSKDGEVFYNALTQAPQGLSPADQQRYAMQVVENTRMLRERDDLRGQLEKLQKASTDSQKKEEILRKQAGFNPNSAGTVQQPTDDEGETPPQNQNASLADRIRANLKAADITDEDLVESH